MRCIFRAAAVLAALSAFVVAAPASAATPQQRTVSSIEVLDAALLGEVNALRRRHGLAPLRRSPQLAAAAAAHSRAMATRGFFAHASSDGSPFWRRVQRFYGPTQHRYWSVGENLLWASPTLDAKRALRRWLESPPHRRNLLSREWREIGFSAVHASSAPGTFGGREVVLVTANFGVRR